MTVALAPQAAASTAYQLDLVAGGAGSGTATTIGQRPTGVAVAGTGASARIYVADTSGTSCTVRTISSTGQETVLAGESYCYWNGDGGPASAAGLDVPAGVAVDAAGNVVIADTGENLVRLVAASTCASSCAYGLPSTTAGDIYTVAGTSGYGYGPMGGPATSAAVAKPEAVAVDHEGDLVVAGTNNDRVTLVAGSTCSSSCPFGLPSTTAGDIYTIAGTGASGFAGDGAAATAAQLNNPYGVAVDPAGNVLVADTGNGVVRMVAGTTCSSSCPYGLASTTAGDMYVVAGNGTGGDNGDGGPATSAEIGRIAGVAVDAAGNLYLADPISSTIRMVAASSCSSSCPYGLASTTGGDIYLVSGQGSGEPVSGMALQGANLDRPSGVTVTPAGQLLIADTQDNAVWATQATTVVPPALTVTTTGLPGATVGSTYSATLVAANGTTPYAWSITGGQLPRGLSLDPTTGTISGTPSVAGNASVTFEVTDATSATATATLALDVAAAPATSPPATSSPTTPEPPTLPPTAPTTAPQPTTPTTPPAPQPSPGSGIVVATTGTSGAVGSVEAEGLGQGGLVVRHYPADPVPALQAPAGTSFYDVAMTPGSSFSSVQFVVCGDRGGVRVAWWDPARAAPVPVTSQSAPDASGCVTVTVDATTSPSLAQLYGTVFVIPASPAAAAALLAPAKPSVVSAATRRAGGDLAVRVACANAACVGAVDLSVARRHGNEVVHVVLARGRYGIRPGARAWVPLAPTAAGRRILPRSDGRSGWEATATVTATEPWGQPAGSRRAVTVEWLRRHAG